MSQVKSATVSEVRDYFSDELKGVMKRQKVDAERDSFEYLVDLTIRYMKAENFFPKNQDGKTENNFLALMYMEYLQGRDATTRKLALKRLGDVSLLITGFFPDSLKRKVVDLDYYQDMGGAAYWQLSNFQPEKMLQTLFEEMAVKFSVFAEVLSEVSERTGLQSNSDILRLYEKWLLTGSERLRGVLVEKGISFPHGKVDPKTPH